MSGKTQLQDWPGTGHKLLFENLFGSGGGFVEILAIKEGRPKVRWFKPETLDYDELLSLSKCKYNVYFGPLLRRQAKKTGRAQKNDIAHLSCLYVDLDAKDFGDGDSGKHLALERLQHFINRNLVPYPTAIVDSGNGYHIYWVLRKPIRLGKDGTITIQEAETYLKGIAELLHGDRAAAEVSRVLRVPGLKNLKNPKSPKECLLIQLDEEKRYTLADFTPVSAETKLMNFESRQRPPGSLSELLDKVSPKMKTLVKIGNNGDYRSRSEADQAVITELLAKGATEDQIFEVFGRFPIGEKYREEGRNGVAYLKHSVEKGRLYVSERGREAPRQVTSRFTPPIIEVSSVLPKSGWLKDYFETLAGATDAPEEFHVLTGLTTIAGLVGKRVVVPRGAKETYLNLFIVIVDPSGEGRKSTSLGIAEVCFDPEMTGKDFSLPNDFSIEGLVEDFSKQPERVTVTPELGRLLKTLKRSYNEQGGIEILTDLYDNHRLEIKRKGEERISQEAVLSILSASTAEWLIESLRPQDFQGGLWPRFLMCYGVKRKSFPDEKDIRVEARRLGCELKELVEAIEYATETDFSLAKEGLREVGTHWQAVASSLGRDPRSLLLKAVCHRQQVHTKKLAALYAISRGQGPAPTTEDVELAKNLTDYLFKSMEYVVNIEVCFSETERHRKDVFNVILTNPGITKGGLTRKTQALRQYLRNDFLSELQEMKMIVKKHEEDAIGRVRVERFYPWQPS